MDTNDSDREDGALEESDKTPQTPPAGDERPEVTTPTEPESDEVEDTNDRVDVDYDSSSIQVLEGLEAVRKRPGMYIWNTSTEGLHHLIWEVVDNSIDEVMAGHARKIDLTLRADGTVTVLDDGRGIPIDIHKGEGVPALELVMCRLHAGGKFDKKAYKVSGGLHGVGVSVVNALSEWLEVQVFKDGKIHEMRFRRGQKTADMAIVGETDKHGTRVTFKPDHTIFDTVEFEWEIVLRRCRELAYLLGRKGLYMTCRNETLGEVKEFRFRGGIQAFVHTIAEKKNPIHKDIIYFAERDVPHPELTGDDVPLYAVEVAFQYTEEYTESVWCYANNIHTVEGGTHLSGFRAALTRSINGYAKREKLLKDNEDPPKGDDFREGLVAVVSVAVPEPQFGGQMKGKLGNREVQGIVESVVARHLERYMEENPSTAKTIYKKARDAASARMAARKARDLARRKTTLASGNLPKKLADCMSRSRDETELFLVEGDSAGGTAKAGRRPEFQAILPLRGKILNVEKARLEKMLAHEEIQAIISAVGAGVGHEKFEPNNLRYGKIIIMTDADVDGSHIRTLLLTFFYRHMRPLIELGHVYIAQPPLFRIKYKGKEEYLLSEEEKNAKVLEICMEMAELEDRHTERIIRGEDLSKLRDLIVRSERVLATAVPPWAGISVDEYLVHQKSGTYPEYLLRTSDGEVFWAFNDEERQRILDGLKPTDGGTLKLSNGPTSEISPLDADVIEVHFANDEEVAEIFEALEKLGITDAWRSEIGRDEARFTVRTSKAERGLKSIFELNRVLVDLGSDAKAGGADIQRYKGLGEMNADQLYDTAMNPGSRRLYQVTIKDAIESDEIFSVLMGSAVEARREFIERHALEVTNLDV
ncbi:MAG: DNA topoisomerase (ATP-hydrolyzing) subunit B [Planctomycetes bacterium]|nr:DNA topoisomerase (ATP-hydrolyzing) subunit B [Planctomycetota bacterium]